MTPYKLPAPTPAASLPPDVFPPVARLALAMWLAGDSLPAVRVYSPRELVSLVSAAPAGGEL